MRLTMPTAAVEGTQLTVMPFREDAVIGTMSVPALVQLVPSPRAEEDARKLKAASGLVRRHAELRATVQRTLKSSQKGKNVGPYAEYIADGLKGELGSAWSTPPVTLWHAGPLAAISDELVPGSGLRTLTIAPGTMVIAIDGETQATAWHDLYDDPEAYGLTYGELAQVRVPFELYVDLAPADARQIFYDRNVQGVAVAKNLAMSMDQRDFGTRLAHRVADSVKVEVDGRRVPFAQLVNASKRQVSRGDREVITLSALRALVVTAVYGRSGLSRTAETVHEDELPAGTRPEQVEAVAVPLLARLISEHFPHLAARSALTAPAVLAGVGIAVHHAMPWSDPASALSAEGLERLLSDIRWEREAAYWDGIAAKAGASGRLNFSGGVKDSGGRVADAILYPATETGRRIRGMRG
ncbi:DNA sulfur modification protein DndB [Streptomyces ossamyceticus]|uniref:DNA sulfur modification protein DndB n=1 Tax=Streptomyces ossamyceticus TaxID=249581 RepID=UPI0036E84DB8